jgi:hypothetical protein
MLLSYNPTQQLEPSATMLSEAEVLHTCRQLTEFPASQNVHFYLTKLKCNTTFLFEVRNIQF